MFNKINVVLRYQPSQWGRTLDSPLNLKSYSILYPYTLSKDRIITQHLMYT